MYDDVGGWGFVCVFFVPESASAGKKEVEKLEVSGEDKRR